MTEKTHFLAEIIAADIAAGRNGGQVVTRFPPEPNGFLHIGHSKSICLNFGLGKQFRGKTHLRFDDTNPSTEETQYVESIQADVKWLGFDWGKNLFYASDFFPQMYDCAVRLVREGKAFVDSQTQDAIREQRGNFDKPGTNSPYRDRSPEENLALFEKMRAGAFKDGECVLRAKIDMAHPNVLMRDPLLYRIRHAHHHRTGNTWCIYPMYDYAHPLEDAFEGITHSICTLEFESNRELYDWVLDNLGPWNPRPHQYEFARLALGYTVMSKRKLLQLVNEKHVTGWDDPRMPTIAGMRRRGVSAEALRALADLVGVAKNNSLVDIGKFEFAIRSDLEARSPRALAVIEPLKVTLTNWPAGKVDTLSLPWWPDSPDKGVREVPFGAELFIDREDFSEAPPKDWKRLAPGREVRLLNAYVVKCDEVVKSASGEVVELRCTVDLSSRGGEPADHRKVSGTLHWVHATLSKPAELRLYDRLFKSELPDAGDDFLKGLNPDALKVAKNARVEPALAKAEPGARYQFVRQGYFVVDTSDSKPGAPVFNRTITLRDTWAKPSSASAPERRPKDKPKGESPKVEAVDPLAPGSANVGYFESALRAHGKPESVRKWLLNELLALADGRALSSLPLSPERFGAFVALVDAGKVTQSGAKTLLADLVTSGADPAQRLSALGLEKSEDAGEVTRAIEKALSSQAAEVARYRAGEKKLFGVLLGAAMREVAGKADAAAVRESLTKALGT